MDNTIVASKNLAGENTSQGRGVLKFVRGKKWNTNKLQTDVLGRILIEQEIDANENRVQINASQLSAGIFIVTVKNDNAVLFKNKIEITK